MFDSWHYVLFIFPQYDFLPETGTFRHCRQSQLPSPPRIRDITYASGGDMVSPTTPLSSHPCTISLQQVKSAWSLRMKDTTNFVPCPLCGG